MPPTGRWRAHHKTTIRLFPGVPRQTGTEMFSVGSEKYRSTAAASALVPVPLVYVADLFEADMLVSISLTDRLHRQQMQMKALQQQSAEQLNTTPTDLVAKKHALVSELSSVVSACQVLQRDIKRLRKEIVTAGMCDTSV